MNKTLTSKFTNLKRQLGQASGIFEHVDASKHKLQMRDLTTLVDLSKIEKIDRGIYRIIGSKTTEHDDLFIVSKKIPKGIICLISALAFHSLTTQIPRVVDIALGKGSEKPRMAYLPVRIHWFSMVTYQEGVENHKIGRMTVQIFCPEKTIADCFKFRNKIGIDVPLEALKIYLRKKPDIEKLMDYAKACRVGKIMQSYLEALT